MLNKLQHQLNLIAIGIFSLIIYSCGNSAASVEETQKNEQTLEKIIQQNRFEIDNLWMQPLRGNQISLVGNPNQIKMYSKDSVSVYLPYYGVRQFGGGYGSSGAIDFTGKPKDFKIEKNKKGRYIITFEGNYKTEAYNFKITLFNNLTTETYVRSNQRDNISYSGNIKLLDSTKTK